MSAAEDNPFPGLRPFEEHEARLFFGREREITELLGRMMRQHFLAVLGSSGCGKSSLIKAGLIPSLKYEEMDHGERAWRVAVMRPGSNPFKNLAIALAGDEALGKFRTSTDASVPIMQMLLRRGPLGIAEAVREADLPPEAKLLILVDQFEELFRFSDRRGALNPLDDARAFVNLLLMAATQRDYPIYVVLTMRSEFLGNCAAFQGLADAITDGLYLLPDMTRDQLREVIQRPIADRRAEVTERLINRLLNDIGGNSDQLPILQHALMRLWTHWSLLPGQEPIDVQHYSLIGELKASLSRHAEVIYEGAEESGLESTRERELAETLFRSLTEITPEGQTVRKPTKLGTICRRAGANADEVKRIIEKFRADGRSFLMPPKGIELDDETTIDISHESLIRQWKRLSEWAQTEAKELKLYADLKRDAVSWTDNGRKPSWLYTGPRLAEAEQWSGAHPNLVDDALAKEFLSNSSEHQKYAGLLLRAGKWDQEGRDDSLLLRGKELREAESWLPSPVLSTKEVRELVRHSRRNVTLSKMLKVALAAAFGAILALAFVAWQNAAQSRANYEESERHLKEVEEQKNIVVAQLARIEGLKTRLGINDQEVKDADGEIKRMQEVIQARRGVQVRYFYKPADGNRVVAQLEGVGYSVDDTPRRGSAPTNAIWWGEGISLEHVKFIALVLIQDGVHLQYIGRSERQKGLIQIGGRPESIDQPYWNVSRVQQLTSLPVNNEGAP